eukprot:347412_1
MSQNDKTELTASEIDKYLDEIEEKEKKSNKDDGKTDWDEITKKITSGNLKFIKTIISSKIIEINTQNPSNGFTLLFYAVIMGNINLVKLCFNCGVNANIKDNEGNTAIHYAIKYGRYEISQLLFYRSLSGSLGTDLKEIAIKIRAKTEEADFMLNKFYFKPFAGKLVDFICQAIKRRAPFSADMLFYAWYCTENGHYEQKGGKGLQSALWKAMMKQFESILCNTQDIQGWDWLKRYFLPCLIWYLPRPGSNTKKKVLSDDDNDFEKTVAGTLFNELLKRVREESKKQSDKLLKKKIDNIKYTSPDQWKQLISYNVHTEHSANARQDDCECLSPRYYDNDLNETEYPPTFHFNAKKHYDKNMYLNELLFLGNVIDPIFQNDMKVIVKHISDEIGEEVSYKAGPVKTLARSQTKVETDYISEKYPTAARILDINRCAIEFKSVELMMKFLDIFCNKIKSKETMSIMSIIRAKNGWAIYNESLPAYTDLKLNVLVKTEKGSIIAEIQFLLKLMSDFKKVAHKLYSIERKNEFCYHYQKLVRSMSDFKDIKTVHELCMVLIQQNDFKYFKLLWESIERNETTLLPQVKKIFNSSSQPREYAVYRIFTSNHGEFYKYLTTNYNDLFYDTICAFLMKYIKQDPNSWAKLLIAMGNNVTERLLKYLIDTTNRQKLMDLLYREPYPNKPQTFMQGLCSSDKFSVMWNAKILTNDDRSKLLIELKLLNRLLNIHSKNDGRRKYRSGLGSCNETSAIEVINFIKDKKELLSKLLTGGTVTLFMYLCRQSVKLLNLSVLNNPIFDSKYKMSLLSQQDSSGNTPLFYAAWSEKDDQLMSLINFVGNECQEEQKDSDSVQQIFTLSSHQNKQNETVLMHTKTSGQCMMTLMKYFYDRNIQLFVKLIFEQFDKNKKNTCQRIFYKSDETIIKQKYVGMEWLMSEVLNGSKLTDEQKLKLLGNTWLNLFSQYILEFMQNLKDKQFTMKMLSSTYDMNTKVTYHNVPYQGTVTVDKIIQVRPLHMSIESNKTDVFIFILNNALLSNKDKISLLSGSLMKVLKMKIGVEYVNQMVKYSKSDSKNVELIVKLLSSLDKKSLKEFCKDKKHSQEVSALLSIPQINDILK